MAISLVRRVTVMATCTATLVLTGGAAAWSAPGVTVVAAPHGGPTPPGGDTGGGAAMPADPMAYELGRILASLDVEQLETTFLAQLVAHHRAVVDMAKLEVERGADTAVRDRARTMVTDQEKQADQGAKWLRDWYGMTPEQATRKAPAGARKAMTALREGMTRMVEDLRGVDKGKNFDTEFARRMVSLDSAAAVEFPAAQVRATHPELRAAAASGMTSQLAGITELIGWLTGQVADAQERGTLPAPATRMPRGTAHAGAGGTQASAALPAVAGAALLACGAGLGLTLARRRRAAAVRRG
ncbi:DUF305 domain-containing protein [Streptomyces sp. B3I8]|uniref:DUF305 domain-containing protein n=1 Tax=Streptomyces sp. B3I8 TaxID=3042303 RepID=UPI00277E6492|nr:DUF305 domain-containing protein [Streptomyces sp. B3I8]MDQ0791191.1 uncharacterized protein (DUF305 family) [Streptomyces sp. B3I8]